MLRFYAHVTDFEPTMGIEPTTPSLPRKYSTPELRRLAISLEFQKIQLIIKRKSIEMKFLLIKPISLTQNVFTKERETRFELATYSLEGYRSTN